MSNLSYSTSFTVDGTPAQVFDAINDVRSWWMTTVDGDNRAVGDEFSYRVPDVHFCTMRVTELVPGERVVWTVVDNQMTFIDDQSEWIGTEIRFELSEKDGGTELRFTHDGLVPSLRVLRHLPERVDVLRRAEPSAPDCYGARASPRTRRS